MYIIKKFYADWCGPCKTLTKTLGIAVENDTRFMVEEINIDLPENTDLVTQHNVKSIPFVLIEDIKGNILTKFNGAKSVSQLKEILNSL